MLLSGYSDEQIAWFVFDIMFLNQKQNLRDEIAEPAAGPAKRAQKVTP